MFENSNGGNAYNDLFEVLRISTFEVDALCNESEYPIAHAHDRDLGFRVYTYKPFSGEGVHVEEYRDYEDAKDYAHGSTALFGCISAVRCEVSGENHVLYLCIPHKMIENLTD